MTKIETDPPAGHMAFKIVHDIHDEHRLLSGSDWTCPECHRSFVGQTEITFVETTLFETPEATTGISISRAICSGCVEGLRALAN